MNSIKDDINKYTPRKEQQDALDFIIDTKSKNKDIKFFLLNMPTGVGKSYMAMMISNYYLNKIDKNAKIDIITAGKILQDQYDNTYESINNLKGKENYQCSQYTCSCSSGKEFNRLNKTSCDFCPYDSAKGSFINGKISLTNFHLYLIYALYNNGVMEQRKANVLIVDEAHLLDEVMSDFISIKISESIIKKMKFTNENEIIKKMKKVSTIIQYITFLEYLNIEVNNTVNDIDRSMMGGRDIRQDKRDLKIIKMIGGDNGDIKLMQIISDLKQYQVKIELFLKEYKENPNNWILETYLNEKLNQKELSLEPIWAYDYLNKYVWSKYDMVILMSGTILDKKIFSDLNGLDDKISVYYSVSSPFPLKNRPIYYLPLGKMSYLKKEETFKNYKSYLYKILKKYEGKKGIIHTNSFELSNWIKDSIDDPRLIFHDSSNKDEMLKMHIESDIPTVIVSPSMSVGVSLDGDLARFQIIAKVPYPSLSSKKNKMRMSNNPDWYSWKTCANIQQSFGRIVRSNVDYGDTIVLDSSFGDVLRYSSNFIPNWVQDAIKKIEVK